MYHHPHMLAMLARERQLKLQREAEQHSLIAEARASKRAATTSTGRQRRRNRFADLVGALGRVARPAT